MTLAGSPQKLGTRVQLRVKLADQLRLRIRQGEWAAGDQLPTEGEIAASYGVSRSTVRAALQLLENQGITLTRHGVGTFVSPFGKAIRSGLQELTSMSETVLAHGMTPGMRFRSIEFRGARENEAKALQIMVGSRVLATERSILANGEEVAYSFDAIPASLLPDDLQTKAVEGSLFSLLEANGKSPRTAVASLHATSGEVLPWPDADPKAQFLLLEQIHYDAMVQSVLFSKTYFLEGRFEFSILRTR